MATDIWLFHLETHESRKITDWEGTDSQPMWHGEKVFYLSDAGPNHRLNIWSFDTRSGARKQLTHYKEFDVKWPAIGPGADGGGEVVFQYAADLVLLDLASGKTRTVEITIPGDLPTIRPKDVDVKKNLGAWNISSTGKPAVFDARGDSRTVPPKLG